MFAEYRETTGAPLSLMATDCGLCPVLSEYFNPIHPVGSSLVKKAETMY